MNICFITTEFVSEDSDFDGGLANYLFKISSALIREGHKVLVIVQSSENHRFEYEGVPVERVKVNFENIFLKITKKALKRSEDLDWLYGSYILNKRLKQINEQEKFDIVQYSSFRAIGFFRIKTVKAIVRLSSFHSYLLGKFDNEPLSKIDKKLAWLEQEAVKRADKVFAPSNVIAQAMSKATGVDIKVIETLYETPKAQAPILSDEYKYLEGKKFLLFVGKLNGVKGAVTIGESIYRILDNNKEIYFVFAGRDAGCMQMIVDNAKEYAERLIFLDRVPKGDLYEIMKLSYGVVLPSQIDNLPNACIEAMSLGKIVIGTDGASFEQLIVNNESGFLIGRGNSDDLVQKVSTLLELDKENKFRMESLAKKRIELLSPSRVVKSTLDFYNTANNTNKNDKRTNT